MFFDADFSRYKKNIILILLTYFSIFAYSHVFFMLPPFLLQRGFQPQSIGWVMSAFYLAATMTRPTAGWFLSQFGIRKTMLFAGSVCFAGACLFACIPLTPHALWGLRFFMGAGFSVFVVATTTYQTLVIPAAIRGPAFSITSIGGVLTSFSIIPLAEFFIKGGHSTYYLFMASLASLVSMCVASFLPPVEKNIVSEGNHHVSYLSLFKETPIKYLLISCLFLGLTDSSIAYASSLAIGRGLNSSIFLMAISSGAVIVRLFGGGLYKKVSRIVIAAPAIGLMGGALMGASFAGSNSSIALWGFLYGVAVGYGYPTHLALIGDMIPEYFRGHASSMVYFAMDISWTLLPIYIGYASALTNVSWAFRGFSLFACVASVLVYIFVWKRIRKNK